MKLTLCGSTQFEPHWHEWNKKLTLEGHVVYSLAVFPSTETEREWYTAEIKQKLDLAHMAKIDESDAIVVLNINGYIGESTKREVEWARLRNKLIYWVNAPGPERRPSISSHRYPEGVYPYRQGEGPVEDLVGKWS